MASKGQKEKILEHLKQYGTISTYEAFKLYGITRISSRICELENDGIRIDSEWEKSKNGTTYKRYMLHFLTCGKCGHTFTRDDVEVHAEKPYGGGTDKRCKCPKCGHIKVIDYRGRR